MNVATSTMEVGVRELKNRLSHYLDRVRDGDEVIVTVHGRPVARLGSIGRSEDQLATLIDDGVVRPPAEPDHQRPTERIRTRHPVSDLVADQRR